ncbi:hypothetical protein CDL15_Pgr012465 [Punica granatum]|uniref:Uncharacterized protein n=1 Tax=Punica granatum TaxID=22663 RepID=A0A218WYN9_PUNGR|nr:hypothetical protein CDL15_Pgr012465 [Punica granatum]
MGSCDSNSPVESFNNHLPHIQLPTKCTRREGYTLENYLQNYSLNIEPNQLFRKT